MSTQRSYSPNVAAKRTGFLRNLWKSAALTCVGILAVKLAAANPPSKVAGRALEGWLQDLQFANETVRLRAAKTIGLFGPPAVPHLIRLLEDSDDAVRYWAASHLGNLGAEATEASEALQRAFQNARSLPVRMAVGYALSRIDRAGPWFPPLYEGAQSPQRSMACAAADFFARIGPPANTALPLLQSIFNKHSRQGGDYHVRGAVKNAIRAIQNQDRLEHHARPSGGNYSRRNFALSDSTTVPPPRSREEAAGRPNILWISCEDISPNLGCYGDDYASTPNLDQLAEQGVRFTQAFTPSGVCAVNRTGIITGMYPVAYGGQHMRAKIPFPPGVRCFPEYLRQAGYFCTNKSKTDYQSNPDLRKVWDRQGAKHGDWRDRKPGQPFFSVINLTITHESQIRHGEGTHAALQQNLQPNQIHNPALAAKYLPPIYPNTPETRKDWAWYHDNISEMDRQAGQILQRLNDDGLADNTIVIFWSDHGRGLPRGKRWIYDSGVHIPMIVRWPGRLKAGAVNDELISTQDLPPTVLALAGLQPKDYMHGRIFLGDKKQPAPKMLFFHRDRMDEALEFMRAARDKQFKYIRNFEPERPYAQHIDYMDKMPTLVDMRRLHQEGKLNSVQSLWFRSRKPIEELYDIITDPHETNNLATLPKHQKTLKRMRDALETWQVQVGDSSFVPEPILFERLTTQ